MPMIRHQPSRYRIEVSTPDGVRCPPESAGGREDARRRRAELEREGYAVKVFQVTDSGRSWPIR